MPTYLMLLMMLLLVGAARAQEVGQTVQISPDNANRLTQAAVLGGGFITEPVWTPDGSTIAVAGSLGVWLYDAGDLQALPRLLEGHSGEVTSLAFSPDGRSLVTGGADGDIRLWNITTGESSVLFSGVSAGSRTSVAISADGRLLAAGGSGLIYLYDLQQGRALAPIEGVCPYFIGSLVFSPDGDLLACGTVSLGDVSVGMLGVWDLSRGVPLTEPFPDFWMVDAQVAFSADGGTLVAWDRYPVNLASDLNVRFWDVESRALVLPPEWWRAEVYVPEFSLQDDHVALSSTDAIEIRDFSSGELLFSKPTERLQGLAFHPDGGRIAYAADNVVHVWDFASNETTSAPRRHVSAISVVAFSPGGTSLAYAAPEQAIVGVWSLTNTGEVLPALPIMDQGQDLYGVIALVYSPDGERLAAGTQNGSVHVWDTASGEPVGQVQVLNGTIYRLAYDHSDQLVVFGCGEAASDSRDVIVLAANGWCEGRDIASAVNRDLSVFAAADYDGEPFVYTHDFESMDVLQRWQMMTAATALALNPAGDQLAVGNGTGVMGGTMEVALQLLQQGESAVTLLDGTEASCETQVGRINALTYSPDGRLLALASGESQFQAVDNPYVHLWNVETGDHLVTLEGHTRWVNDVAFNPQGTMLASVGADAAVRLWTVGDAEVPLIPPDCPDPSEG